MSFLFFGCTSLLLVAANLVVPLLFFIARFEAQIVVVTMLVGAMLMIFLTARTGFSRLLGLGHILWIPLIIYLWTRLDAIPAGDVYGVWTRSPHRHSWCCFAGWRSGWIRG